MGKVFAEKKYCVTSKASENGNRKKRSRSSKQYIQRFVDPEMNNYSYLQTNAESKSDANPFSPFFRQFELDLDEVMPCSCSEGPFEANHGLGTDVLTANCNSGINCRKSPIFDKANYAIQQRNLLSSKQLTNSGVISSDSCMIQLKRSNPSGLGMQFLNDVLNAHPGQIATNQHFQDLMQHLQLYINIVPGDQNYVNHRALLWRIKRHYLRFGFAFAIPYDNSFTDWLDREITDVGYQIQNAIQPQPPLAHIPPAFHPHGSKFLH
jgi:hypothetical protein